MINRCIYVEYKNECVKIYFAMPINVIGIEEWMNDNYVNYLFIALLAHGYTYTSWYLHNIMK